MEDDELAIGIHIGETNCCVAAFRNGKVDIIPNKIGGDLNLSSLTTAEGLILPDQISGSFWLTDYDENGNEKNLLNTLLPNI